MTSWQRRKFYHGSHYPDICSEAFCHWLNHQRQPIGSEIAREVTWTCWCHQAGFILSWTLTIFTKSRGDPSSTGWDISVQPQIGGLDLPTPWYCHPCIPCGWKYEGKKKKQYLGPTLWGSEILNTNTKPAVCQDGLLYQYLSLRGWIT